VYVLYGHDAGANSVAIAVIVTYGNTGESVCSGIGANATAGNDRL
jgi:hypothetical protein